MSASMQPGRSGGCLKCGEQGHWARDCQAPREKWISRNSTQATENTGQDAGEPQNNNDPNTENLNIENRGALPQTTTADVKRKRPKLTYELLNKANGIPEVYHNFSDIFRQKFRGKGHEISDLRHLLEIFRRWQNRIFPHGTFDNFISLLEKHGATNVVKSDMNQMRMALLQQVEEAMAQKPPEDTEQEDGGLEGCYTAGREENAQEEDNEIDLDDELLELAAAAPAVLGGGQVAISGDDIIDDDELLALAAQAQKQNNNITNVEDDINDDELLQMAMMQ